MKAFVIEMPSTYLQCQVEPLLAVPFVVQTFLKPQGAALLLLVTDHIELLLLVSRHNTKGQLGVFTNVPVLCCKIQDLRTSYNQQLHCVKGTGYLHFDNKKDKKQSAKSPNNKDNPGFLNVVTINMDMTVSAHF